MKKPLACTLLALAALLSAQASAADPTSERSVAIIPRAGMLGVGADISIPLAENFNARFGYGTWKRSRDLHENDIEYDGKLRLAGGLAVLDWFPINGNLRLSAGLARNQSRLKVTARPTGTVVFGDSVYNAGDISASGELNFRATAPYLGIGYGNPSARSRLGFFLEGGVIRQRTRATLTGTCSDAVNCAANGFDADLARERAELEDSARKYRWFPVLQLGMSVRF